MVGLEEDADVTRGGTVIGEARYGANEAPPADEGEQVHTGPPTPGPHTVRNVAYPAAGLR